jgi:hypothetical protein
MTISLWVVHCLHRDFDVYIGRGRFRKTGAMSKYGNPFSHLPNSLAQFKVLTRSEAIAKHRAWILGELVIPDFPPPTKEEIRLDLSGKVLGCWCRPRFDSCHGDVLAEIANA